MRTGGKICHVYGVTTDRVLDWILDLLTTYTGTTVQVTTAPSLISTLYKSPQHTLIFFYEIYPESKDTNSRKYL
jgi:hypothetical protein